MLPQGMGSAGKMHFGFVGTYLIADLTTPVSAIPSTSYDCAGYYGAVCNPTSTNGPVARWRHELRTTWSTPWKGADVSLAWRYIAPVKLDQLNPNPNLRAVDSATAGASNAQLIADGVVPNTNAYFSSRSYLDLSGSFNLDVCFGFVHGRLASRVGREN